MLAYAINHCWVRAGLATTLFSLGFIILNNLASWRFPGLILYVVMIYCVYLFFMYFSALFSSSSFGNKWSTRIIGFGLLLLFFQPMLVVLGAIVYALSLVIFSADVSQVFSSIHIAAGGWVAFVPFILVEILTIGVKYRATRGIHGGSESAGGRP